MKTVPLATTRLRRLRLTGSGHLIPVSSCQEKPEAGRIQRVSCLAALTGAFHVASIGAGHCADPPIGLTPGGPV